MKSPSKVSHLTRRTESIIPLFLKSSVRDLGQSVFPPFDHRPLHVGRGLHHFWKIVDTFPRSAGVDHDSVVENRFFSRITHRIQSSTPAALEHFHIDCTLPRVPGWCLWDRYHHRLRSSYGWHRHRHGTGKPLVPPVWNGRRITTGWIRSEASGYRQLHEPRLP